MAKASSLLCLPCRLLGCILNLICTILLLVIIAAVAIYVIYRPNYLKFHVVNASLTEFKLTNDSNNLVHNLKIDVAARNPNKKIGVYYDHIEAVVLYGGEEFDRVILDGFHQGSKNTTLIKPVFQGNGTVRLGGSDIKQFNKESNDGAFNIDLRMFLRVRFKVGILKTFTFKPKVKCDVKVPLTANGAAVDAFAVKKCEVHYHG
ncbi:hypothetical protein ACHQM5_019915 [Ranunculus cassubicifolius]